MCFALLWYYHSTLKDWYDSLPIIIGFSSCTMEQSYVWLLQCYSSKPGVCNYNRPVQIQAMYTILEKWCLFIMSLSTFNRVHSGCELARTKMILSSMCGLDFAHHKHSHVVPRKIGCWFLCGSQTTISRLQWNPFANWIHWNIFGTTGVSKYINYIPGNIYALWCGCFWQLYRNPMMTSSNGHIFRVTAPLWGEFTGPRGEFPSQRPVTRRFDVFFDLRLNNRLNKQSWGWWFETPSRSLWRHCNALGLLHRHRDNHTVVHVPVKQP